MERASLRMVAIAAGLAAMPVAATDWNWADDPYAQRPEYAESVAICERLRELRPPAVDHPNPAQAQALADCDSEALYYGIGMAADPVRARQCALFEAEAAEPDQYSSFSGNGLLMTIYANGIGAERNLDLATAFACGIHGAPFEVVGRVQHLQALKASPQTDGDFSYCDDITSGTAGAICARHAARLDEDRRVHRLAGLSERWSDTDRAAFDPLHSTATAFARISAENEVDLSGSSRWAFVAQHEQQLLDAFLALLETLESNSLPIATRAELTAADDRLNAVYRQLMTLPAEADAPAEHADRLGRGTVTRSGVREAQRAWIGYRDAWITFAAKRYWQMDDSVATWLTRQRADDLARYLPEHG